MTANEAYKLAQIGSTTARLEKAISDISIAASKGRVETALYINKYVYNELLKLGYKLSKDIGDESATEISWAADDN